VLKLEAIADEMTEEDDVIGGDYDGVTAHPTHLGSVPERGVERSDAMRLARDERVNCDRHDARHFFAFAVQRVELALQQTHPQNGRIGEPLPGNALLCWPASICGHDRGARR
jgi:hypothetical protein